LKQNSNSGRARGALGASTLTPLLDTLFLLLFALLASSQRASTAPTEALSEEVRVELPTVDELQQPAHGDEPDVRLVVHVDATGVVNLLGAVGAVEATTAGALRTALEAQSADATGRLVVEIRADEDARHGVTVDVLQAVRAAGIVDVRFVATKGLDTNDTRRFGDAAGGAR
jgi:biopolymer transport protein ExbD